MKKRLLQYGPIKKLEAGQLGGDDTEGGIRGDGITFDEDAWMDGGRLRDFYKRRRASEAKGINDGVDGE